MEILISSVVIGFLLLFGLIVMLSKFYRTVEQGQAMIVNTMRAEPDVTFTGKMVIPVLNRCEIMDISLKTIDIERFGKEGLICKDNIRADIKVKFFVRVNKSTEDVLRVAQAIGCDRASHQETLENLFQAKFSEALKTVGKGMDFVDLYQARERFRDEIIRQIGEDLSGYHLEDAAIDYIEQTPLEKLDPSNILDAQGIKKITELTAEENIRTNEFRRNEEMRIKKKDVETAEAVLELERQQAFAQAQQQREIATTKAREDAEAAKVQQEERAKSELARLATEQLINVQSENLKRETQVAENNRLRAVAIEEEKVTRARQLEVVDREREVALQQIERDKQLEVQRKSIADVVRERIVVERTVAEQEEAIKDIRTVADAERTKKASVVLAQGEAEQKYVAEVKLAEAQEQRAKHQANQELTLAEARLIVAGKEAEAKKREAEGAEALAAADGLAAAKVQLARADAVEKEGLVNAKIKLASAEAIQKYGAAEAEAMKSKLQAEAVGKQNLGEAEAAALKAKLTADAEGRIVEAQALAEKLAAEAQGRKQLGDAEAAATAARFAAESAGLKDKFEAMKLMSPETRAHEEQRMQMDYQHIQRLKALETQQSVAREQAEVLAQALKQAKLEIVGGDGEYFDRFMRSLSIGRGIDAAIGQSELLAHNAQAYREGTRDVVADARDLVAALGGSAGNARDLSIAGTLKQLLSTGKLDKAELKKLVDTL
jgi:uncharacterized membrane protein YqiK